LPVDVQPSPANEEAVKVGGLIEEDLDRFYVATNAAISVGDGRNAVVRDAREDDSSTTSRSTSNGAVAGPETEFVYFAQPGELWNDLDQLHDEMGSNLFFRNVIVGSAAMTSAGLTVGYVMWMIRGGMLLSGVLLQMPAWRMVDPLIVLDRVDGGASTRREANSESLESIIVGKGVGDSLPSGSAPAQSAVMEERH
jgi:hypothetical protein